MLDAWVNQAHASHSRKLYITFLHPSVYGRDLVGTEAMDSTQHIRRECETPATLLTRETCYPIKVKRYTKKWLWE